MKYRQTKFPDDLISVLDIKIETENKEDMIKGIYYVVDNVLDDRQRKIIRKKYIECKRVADVATMMNITQTAASSEIYKTIKIMQLPENAGYIKYGLEQYKEMQKRKEIALKRRAPYDTIIIKNINIEELLLPPKAYASLCRAGIKTYGDLLQLMQEKKNKWYKMNGIGDIYSDRIFQHFKNLGIVSGTKDSPKILLKDMIPQEEKESIYKRVQKMTEQEFAKWLMLNKTDIYMKCNNEEDAIKYVSESFFDRNKNKNKKKHNKNNNQQGKEKEE